MVEPYNLNALVSVLIPTNDLTFIDDTIESVFGQTYKDLDIVVVLNGLAVSEMFNLEQRYSPKVRFFRCNGNGIVPSLNLGLANCRGALIARIDADDLMPPERIERQVKFLQENPTVVCVGGQLEYIAHGGNPKKHPGYPIDDATIKHSLYRFSAMPHPGLMYRKKEVLAAGGYSTDFPLIEDWNLIVKLAESHKLANLDTTVVHYRIHLSQSTVKNSTLQENSIQAFAKFRLKNEFLSLKNGDNLPQGLLRIRRSLAGYLYLYSASNSSGALKKLIRLINLLLISLLDPRIPLDYMVKKFHRLVA